LRCTFRADAILMYSIYQIRFNSIKKYFTSL